LVGDQIATDWKNDVGGTIFQQQITAHPEINATVEANDGLGNAVIQVLKNRKVKAKSIPTTGQDATLDGMVNVLTDYQCGSVYKAVYLEAQDAVSLATVLRAGATPPSGLVNGTTAPPSGVSGNQQPASLLVPVWVDKSNMEATVIKDKFIDVATLCSDNGAGKSVLTKCIAGIYQPGHGQVFWEGNQIHVRNARDVSHLGIETVYQDLALADNLDIVQNMFLGRERLKSQVLLDEDSMERAAKETLAGLRVTTVRSIRQPVASLSGGQRQ